MSNIPPTNYSPIAMSDESTVVAEYTAEAGTDQSYQSEAALEREFIATLQSQAYEYLPLTSEAELIANLRTQLERLNGTTFSDAEWDRFFTESIAGANEGIAEKTVRIQEDHVQLLRRDDGSTKNIRLLDKDHIHNNRLQVINQYAVDPSDGARYANRYDVTILVNGLPMVHIELKRRGVSIREAFNQIERYQRDSFWAGSGLFEYVQLFVISNGTLTKYYSNTTRLQHLKESTGRPRARKASNSFEFTSWWADATNRPIQDLIPFTRTFFAKHTLLNILTRYCVLTHDRVLLVMRPYQIAATERILQRIVASTNLKQLGTVAAGGYVWHTTGSGKTLTSFKAAQLATKLAGVEKVLFVVDRKDLDYQTMREYDRFEKGAANSNTSTAVLKRQLEDPGAKIIITTIQKLTNFIKSNRGHEIYSGHIVLVFDECHRSQFGDMHAAITKAFRRYHLFGFTGTPIFAENATGGGLKTTEQVFGDRLHTYTIVDAITDKNVLPFRIDYVSTIKVGDVADKQVSAIDHEQALLAAERIEQIVRYTLEHFDTKTKRSSSYDFSSVANIGDVVTSNRRIQEVKHDKRVRGFNALFATASIQAARVYYNAFARLQEDLPPDKRLSVGLIYSYPTNEEVGDGALEEEGFDARELSGDARQFLEDAIQDYNDMFGTSYDTTSDNFGNYYKDLSMRLKNREIDLVIVVNMFLTGFDSTTLNTLFVDKNLRSHGLIQAFSRTNRILNSVKTFGNIVSFRNLETETNDALALFGNKDAQGIALLKPFAHYYEEYAELVTELLDDFPLGTPLVGETAEKRFIALYGSIRRLLNILGSFDDFAGNEILTQRQEQNYSGIYLDMHAQYTKRAESDKESILDDVVFEIELIKQVEINVDYILLMVEQNRDNLDDAEVRANISRAVGSSPTLRNKKDLVEDFVDSLTPTSEVDDQWQRFIEARKDAELDQIINSEGLRPEQTRAFIDAAFADGEVRTTGTAITKVLPPVSRFAPAAGHAEKKHRVLKRLEEFFQRFFGLLSGAGRE